MHDETHRFYKHPLIIIGSEISNDFVNVTTRFSTAAVVCSFINQKGSGVKSCSIVYKQSETCGIDTLRMSPTKLNAQSIYSDTVTIGIPFVRTLHFSERSYCFIINASNGTHTAFVQGTFKGIITIVVHDKYFGSLTVTNCNTMCTGCDPNLQDAYLYLMVLSVIHH